jgi:tetratricopeptide (TPR) repeat protein
MSGIDIGELSTDEVLTILDSSERGGDWKEALSILERLIEKVPCTSLFVEQGDVFIERVADDLVDKGLTLRVRSSIDLSIASYDMAIAIDKDCVEAHLGKGLALHAKQDLANAIVSLERVIDIDEECVQAHLALAWCFIERADEGSAIPHFKRAYSLMPNGIVQGLRIPSWY